MNPDILKVDDENLATLATELGLVVFADKKPAADNADEKESTPSQKSYAQLT